MNFEFTDREIKFLMRFDAFQDKLAHYLLVHGTDNAEVGFDDAKKGGRKANMWQKKLSGVVGYKGATGSITYMDGELHKQGSGALSSHSWTARKVSASASERFFFLLLFTRTFRSVQSEPSSHFRVGCADSR